MKIIVVCYQFVTMLLSTFGSWSVVATTVVLGILLLKLSFGHKSINLPPGPRGLPVIGALHLLGKYPAEDLAKLAKAYGPMMSLWFGQQLTVVASSPAAAEEILKTQGASFSGRLKSSYARIVFPDDITFQSDTPARLHLKKLVHIYLNTAKQIQKTASVRAEEIAHILHMIPQDGITEVSLRGYVDVVVTNIITRMILKKRFMAMEALHAGHDSELGEVEEVGLFREVLARIAKYSLENDLGDFIPVFKVVDVQGHRRRLWKLRAQMDAFMSKVISEHLESSGGDEKDMVDVLLDQVEDETLGFEITYLNVQSVFWNVIAAGIDTTTHVVEWAIAHCIHSPTVMTRAQAELDAVVGKSRRVEEADIPNLKYLQAICKEVFRLHPASPILFPHVNQHACKVFGYDIPALTSVLVNVGAIAGDPSIWEDPLVFKPEMSHVGVQGHHNELLPFGTGRRQCPGIELSLAMVHILTATLLHCFDWSLPQGMQPKDLDMAEAEGIFSVRAKPLTAILKARLLSI